MLRHALQIKVCCYLPEWLFYECKCFIICLPYSELTGKFAEQFIENLANFINDIFH